jgi:hypothetical protein
MFGQSLLTIGFNEMGQSQDVLSVFVPTGRAELTMGKLRWHVLMPEGRS